MSESFTKLFSTITESTVWFEPNPTRILWITMLAMADRVGRVHGSVPGLAHRARITIEECEAGLATFLAPDKHSRTKTDDGRRIEAIDGGWRLLNYGYYRAKRSEAERREYKTAKEREYRAARGHDVDTSIQSGPQRTTVDHGGPIAEAEAEAEKKTPPTPPAGGKPKGSTPRSPRPTVVSDDWQPKPETIASLNKRWGWRNGEHKLAVQNFKDSCAASGRAYQNHDRALLAWDWSKLKPGLAKTADPLDELYPSGEYR